MWHHGWRVFWASISHGCIYGIWNETGGILVLRMLKAFTQITCIQSVIRLMWNRGSELWRHSLIKYERIDFHIWHTLRRASSSPVLQNTASYFKMEELVAHTNYKNKESWTRRNTFSVQLTAMSKPRHFKDTSQNSQHINEIVRAK